MEKVEFLMADFYRFPNWLNGLSNIFGAPSTDANGVETPGEYPQFQPVANPDDAMWKKLLLPDWSQNDAAPGANTAVPVTPRTPVSTAEGTALTTNEPAVDFSGSTHALQAFNYFKSQGWSPTQSAAIVGSLQQESYHGLDETAVGDNKAAYGIGQWHSDRQATFEKVIGKPIKGSTFEDQLRFVNWELNNSHKAAGAALKASSDVRSASKIMAHDYEGAGIEAVDTRAANAQAILEALP